MIRLNAQVITCPDDIYCLRFINQAFSLLVAYYHFKDIGIKQFRKTKIVLNLFELNLLYDLRDDTSER